MHLLPGGAGRGGGTTELWEITSGASLSSVTFLRLFHKKVGTNQWKRSFLLQEGDVAMMMMIMMMMTKTKEMIVISPRSMASAEYLELTNHRTISKPAATAGPFLCFSF